MAYLCDGRVFPVVDQRCLWFSEEPDVFQRSKRAVQQRRPERCGPFHHHADSTRAVPVVVVDAQKKRRRHAPY